MSWPLSQDYNEAIQSPASNFSDPDLRRGEAAANALGLPMPYSGNFADVYQVRCPDGSRWAVKCFTREATGLRERYHEISKHLHQVRLPFTVDFSYLQQGIRVAGRWYPVLKMEWVEGLTLNQFVARHLDKPSMLESLSKVWARMAKHLREANVGHCDLQHGNVLLAPGLLSNSLALKLIDYDGMWVPALAGKKSGEVGHPCYQHPQRLRDQAYNIDVDRFPVLLIATALRALKVHDKDLWEKHDNGDNLLFREADLLAPLKSHLFLDLTKTGDPVITQMMDLMVKALRGKMEAVPLLEEVITETRPMPSQRPLARPGPKTTPATPFPAAAQELPITAASPGQEPWKSRESTTATNGFFHHPAVARQDQRCANLGMGMCVLDSRGRAGSHCSDLSFTSERPGQSARWGHCPTRRSQQATYSAPCWQRVECGEPPPYAPSEECRKAKSWTGTPGSGPAFCRP